MTLQAPTSAPGLSVPSQRGFGLDALRAAMTMLVVLHHTAITYGAMGGWFYKEVLPDGSLSSKLLIFFCTFNQAFFMGLFFLLAGYFTPAALARKGVGPYLWDRFVRLACRCCSLVWCWDRSRLRWPRPPRAKASWRPCSS